MASTCGSILGEYNSEMQYDWALSQLRDIHHQVQFLSILQIIKCTGLSLHCCTTSTLQNNRHVKSAEVWKQKYRSGSTKWKYESERKAPSVLETKGSDMTKISYTVCWNQRRNHNLLETKFKMSVHVHIVSNRKFCWDLYTISKFE